MAHRDTLHIIRHAGILALLAGLALADSASAQDPDCPTPPGNPAPGKRIYCLEPADSGNDITIRLNDYDIDTSGRDRWGVYARDKGDGDIDISVTGGTIETSGRNSSGVYAIRGDDSVPQTTGNLDIYVNGVTIVTDSRPDWGGYGVYGDQRLTSTGYLKLRIHNSDITTNGTNDMGILGNHVGIGDQLIDVQGSSIETKNQYSHGIAGRQGTTGNLRISLRNSTVKTQERTFGIHLWSFGSPSKSTEGIVDIQDSTIETNILGRNYGPATSPIYAQFQRPGDLRIVVRNSTLTANGNGADAILGWSSKNPIETSETTIDVVGGLVETKGPSAYGIYGLHYLTADDDAPNHNLRITADGARITTVGNNSYGIRGLHSAVGDIDINVLGNASIETTGAGSTAVRAEHRYSGNKERKMSIFVDDGATLKADGVDAHGIQVGYFQSNLMKGIAPIGADGYRQQTVVINGQVTGGAFDTAATTVLNRIGAAGVLLTGGGKAVIRGRVGSAAGIAIHSARKVGTEDAPNLWIDFQPDGKSITSIIGDDWIINDGGVTTISVNGVVLHDKKGVTGVWAPNGAWKVTIFEEKEGKRLTGRNLTTDQLMTETWNMPQDRDFRAEDFSERRLADYSAIYAALPSFLMWLDQGERGGVHG